MSIGVYESILQGLNEAISTEIRDDLNRMKLNAGGGKVDAKLRKSFRH